MKKSKPVEQIDGEKKEQLKEEGRGWGEGGGGRS